MRKPTVDTESVAQDQIRAFVQRIMRMREEARAINDDIREIYAEAKGNGFDKTVLGKIVLYVEKRGKDANTVAEADALFDLYLEAFDQLPSRTHAHEDPDDDASEHAFAAGHGPSILAPSPDELGTAGDDQGEPDALNTEPATRAAADPTGAGLNPLSPSEEATPPVNNSNTNPGTGAAAGTTASGGGRDRQADVDVPAGTAVSEKVEDGAKDQIAPVPDSEGGHIPSADGSLTPRTIPEPERAAVGEKPGMAIEATTEPTGPSASDLRSDGPAREDGQAGGSVAPVAPVRITAADNARKLRPHCLRADNLNKCAGQGSKHCWECLKAHADAEGLAA